MVFAGQKLRRHRALDNPTVLIVVDRRDLKTQLADDFDVVRVSECREGARRSRI